MGRPRFHLAFPVDDLVQARAFYGDLLGCPEGRSSAEWVDFDFFGHQIVAHLAPGAAAGGETSPVDGENVPVRHFGAILSMDAWHGLAQRLKAASVTFLIPPQIRFQGQAGEQATMFFLDPCGNALEFKAFADDAAVFAQVTITLAEIEAAASRLAGQTVVTPLIESPALNARIGARVLIKPETLQRAGAFKFRGAYNRLAQLDADERVRGVVAFSSGNHAQGVALAARLLGAPALIVMPSDAPRVKIEATESYGAEIRLYDRLTEDRVAIAKEIAEARGAVVVPAFDDPHIIAGQGTVGLELMRQAQATGVALDLAIAPVGGGGLMAGIATAMQALSPATRLIGVEPAGFDDTLRSLRAGARQTLPPTTRSLCDALESPAPGELTFPILQRTLTGIAVVTDAEVAEAMRFAFSVLKLVVEPGGSVGLAALLAGKIDVAGGGTVGLVLSGGNVDPDLFAEILRARIRGEMT